MKCYLLTKIILALCIVLTIPILLSAESGRRDGNWWVNQPEFTRSSYVTGFFDGMALGYNFSYWGFDNEKRVDDCIRKVVKSYDEYQLKYFRNVSNVQLMDGINTFYSDFRNRRILVSDAVWLVVNGIAGTPQKELDKMIENWRSNTR